MRENWRCLALSQHFRTNLACVQPACGFGPNGDSLTFAARECEFVLLLLVVALLSCTLIGRGPSRNHAHSLNPAI